MNKISKRLLSWLCVIAMVLSFVPVMDLSNFAVETQAAEIVYGSANYDGVDAAIIEQMNTGNAIDNSDDAFATHLANDTCPVCGDISALGGWVELDGTAGKNYGASTEGVKVHYYYADGTETVNGNMLGFYGTTVNSTGCIWIKSTQNLTNTTTRAVMLSGATNTINFFGQGSLTTDVESGHVNMFQVSGGTLNLYGGKFVFMHPQNDFRQAVIRVANTTTVVNIYDEAYIGPETLDTTKVYQNVQYTSGGTVNLFGGTIRNGVSPAWGYSGNVTVSSGGTFNMYAGTISGGTYLPAANVTANVTNGATIGGNVMVGGKNAETYYVSGAANYTTTVGTFNMYGGTITGGSCFNGGNGGGNIMVYNSSAVANFQGGTVSEGLAKAKGGNLQVAGGTVTIKGTALFTDGATTSSDGGNIYVDNANVTLNIEGGKIANGETTAAAANGGNIAIKKIKKLNISGGIISGGETKNHGGNLYLYSDSAAQTTPGVISITGGTFENGVANAQGGNIAAAQDLTLSGVTVTGGTGRKGGGNINMITTGLELTLTDCTVANGWVSGAIDDEGNLSAPTGAQWGGNIRSWCGTVTIDGGLIYGGVRGVDKTNSNAGNNVAVLSSVESNATASLAGASLTIKGDAVIVGDIGTSAPSSDTTGEFTSPGTSVTLAGNPTITNKYTLADGTTVRATSGGLNIAKNSKGAVAADISGLTSEAKVMFTSAALGNILTEAYDGAAALVEAGCFSLSNSAWAVGVNDANQLYVIEYVEPAPEKPAATVGGQNLTDEVWDTMLTAAEIQEAALALDHTQANTVCPACGATVAEWVEATKPGQNTEAVRHYYIDADTDVSKAYNWYSSNTAGVTLCLLLKNGETSKNIGGLMGLRSGATNATFNVMGDGIVTSDGSSISDGNFGVLSIQGTDNTVNLYGGTFIYNKNCVDADGNPNAGALYVRGNGNTVNMFNETAIGPETQDLTTPMYNVLIKCETANKTSTFNMYGGTIRNGVTGDNSGSGNITTNYKANCYTAINIYGGSIENGSHTAAATTTYGGNIYAAAYTKINMYGGTISGGEAKYGGNVYMAESQVSTFNMHGGTVSGGEATTEGGNLITYNKNVNIGQYGLIEDGVAGTGGGNISIKKYSVTTAGHILNGKAGQRGGNIDVNALALTVDGGVIANGTLTAATGGAHWGCNIRSWNGKVTINDGLIYGGSGAVSNTQSNNIGALGDTSSDTTQPELTINGGTIIGDISTSGPKTTTTTTTDETTGEETTTTTVFEGTLVTLSGAPQILMSKEIDGETVVPTAGYGLNLANGIEIDISGLTADANIALTSAKGRVISAARADAEAVAGCFTVENVSNVLIAKNADNKLYIAAVAGAVVDAEGNETAYVDAAEALADYDYDTDLYVVLSGDVEISKNIKLNVKGGTVNLSGSGNVELIDTANDEFEKNGTVTISGDVTVTDRDTTVAGKRYIALQDGSSFTAHRLVMKLTNVTLKINDEPFLYYKASYQCDDALAGRVEGYGVVLSVNNMPGDDFMTGDADDVNAYTMYGAEDFTNLHTAGDGLVNTTSAKLVGTLKPVEEGGRTAEQNKQNAATKIYANAYIAIDTEGLDDLNNVNYFVSDQVNGGKDATAEGFTGVAYSLNDLVEAIDGNWNNYSDAQKTLINNFMDTWGEYLDVTCENF